MFDRLVPAEVGSFAGDVDHLIIFITLIVGVWFFLAEGVFFWLIFRFRAKPGRKGQYITGEEKHQTRWISIPHGLVLLCDVFIVVAAIRVWGNVKQTLPPADETVRVVAQQWAWTFVHPGPDGKLDTADDITTIDELHVKENAVYHFQLEAKDVIHSFSVPVFRLKQDAIPGRTITGWFKADKTGTYDIQCAEICGIGHGIMPAKLVVESPEQHAAWVRSQRAATAALR